jgi:hypothetical protein
VRGLRRKAVLTLGALAFMVAAPAAHAAMSISAPTNFNLGSAPTGTTQITAQLGTVTMSNTALLGLVSGMTATVSFTDFTTAGGGTFKTITKGQFSYWSGPATASSGISLGNILPGQLNLLNAVNLLLPRVAFQTNSLLQLLGVSVSWRPTVILNIPPSAVAGTYTGTITHSVA